MTTPRTCLAYVRVGLLPLLPEELPGLEGECRGSSPACARICLPAGNGLFLFPAAGKERAEAKALHGRYRSGPRDSAIDRGRVPKERVADGRRRGSFRVGGRSFEVPMALLMEAIVTAPAMTWLGRQTQFRIHSGIRLSTDTTRRSEHASRTGCQKAAHPFSLGLGTTGHPLPHFRGFAWCFGAVRLASRHAEAHSVDLDAPPRNGHHPPLVVDGQGRSDIRTGLGSLTTC